MKSEITTEAPEASHAAETLPLDHLRKISASWRMSNFGTAGVTGYVLCRQTVAGWLAFGWYPELWINELSREGDVAVPAHKLAEAHVIKCAAGFLTWEAVS